MSHYYRILSGDRGIYEAVDRDCSREDPRRSHKPDGYWLARVGPQFPDAISFWTREGLQKYVESGLFSWHTSVVKDEVSVLTAEAPPRIVYSDPFQILCKPEGIPILRNDALSVFLLHLMKILD